MSNRDARSRMIATGIGYIEFAEEHRALFRLMFASDRPDREDPDLAAAGRNAFEHLLSCVGAIRGQAVEEVYDDPQAMYQVHAIWAVAHGLADLLASGKIGMLNGVSRKDRRPMLRSMLRNVVPSS